MEDWEKLVGILDKFNCDAQYVAECVYAIVVNEFYNLSSICNADDEKFMDVLMQFINE